MTKERKMVVRAECIIQGSRNWQGELFSIDLAKEKTEAPIKGVGVVYKNKGMCMYSWVMIGSVIYIVGGEAFEFEYEYENNRKVHHSHNGISYIDLASNSSRVWNEARFLTSSVVKAPSLLSFSGKIYLFARGTDIGGVFDPISNTWDTILPPTDFGFLKFDIKEPILGDSENNRILVNFPSTMRGKGSSLFGYYPCEKRWKIIIEEMTWYWNSGIFLNDGLIYLYVANNPEMVAAYELATQKWLTTVVTSEVHYSVWRTEFDSILYLGNDSLCLLKGSFIGSNTVVYVVEFKFKRSGDNLIITPSPMQSYTLASNDFVNDYYALPN